MKEPSEAPLELFTRRRLLWTTAGLGLFSAFGPSTAAAANAGVSRNASATGQTSTQKTVTVTVGAGDNGFEFMPAEIVITPGTTVVWEWTGDGGGHNVVHDAAEPEFESLRTDEAGYTFAHTFETADTYDYVCTPHRAQGMNGTVVVEETSQSDAITVSVGTGQNGFSFAPDDIVIERGTTVVWQWTGSGGGHNVVHDAADSEFESVRTDEPGDTFEHTFGEPGVYDYVCTPHRAQGMDGTITVNDVPGESVTVEVGTGEYGFAFGPEQVVIEPGTTIVWQWTGDGGEHNVVHDTDDPAFVSDRTDEAGATFEHTFEEVGVYEYVCTPHRAQGMFGTIIVDSSADTPSVTDYADRDDGRIHTEGLRAAIGDWREGTIDTALLRDVIDAWRRSEVVT